MMESPNISRKADKKCDPCRIAKQKCNPSERRWDESVQEKCIKCTKAGNDCGPNLTQFDSSITKRAKKRKAEQSLDHGSTTPRPHQHSHGDPNTIELTPGTATSFAGDDDITEPEPTPHVEQDERPVDINSMLETPNKLLWYYKYINHPKQTIFFLEQDGLPQGDPAIRQKDVATYLAWKIRDELASVVQEVDASHCSAERVLLLVQEAVYRFRRIANDPEALLELECEMLDKRVRAAQRSTTPKGKQREAISLGSKGRPLHQRTLEMERNQLIGKIKSSSRSVSPEAASTPSSDRSAGSKRVMKQAGGLFSSREIANLLEGSSVTSHVLYYISARSFAKNRRLRGKERVEFPASHTALLFATEQEARSWARWLESNNGNIELVDFFKRNIAHVAAEVGRVHLLHAVLPGHRKSLDTTDAFGFTPLMIAVLHGRLACCRLLINAGFAGDVRDSRGRNLLSIACRRRHLHIVEYLINELGLPPNDDSGGGFCSPLHDAVEAGDLQISTFLIKSGANIYQHINSKSPGDLALEKALEKEQTAIWQLINEKITRSGSSQVDVVSAHLGYQHGPNPQYNAASNIDHLTSQPYVHDGQVHDAASHSSNVSLYLPTTTNTQYMDPRLLGHGQQVRH